MRTRKAVWSLFASGVALAFANQATAQIVDQNTIRAGADENGVELHSGRVTIASPSISIGTPENGLTFQRTLENSKDWINPYDKYAYWDILNTGDVVVQQGFKQERYNYSNAVWYQDSQGNNVSDWTSTESTGGYVQLVIEAGTSNLYMNYFQKDGTKIVYNHPGQKGTYASYELSPNGKKVEYFYKTSQACGGYQCATDMRIQSITNNSGYQIKFDYAAAEMSVYNPQYLDFTTVTSVRLINNSVDFCNPTADSCTLSQAWPALTFSKASSGTDVFETVTDNLGRNHIYRFDAYHNLRGYQAPGSNFENQTYNYVSTYGYINSINNNGRITNYTISNDATSKIITIAAADAGGTYRTTTAHSESRLLLSDMDALGRTTTFEPDARGRIFRVTFPEGNKIENTYDARDNLTESRKIAKPGTGLADIVTSSGFDTTCTNLPTCNQPNWTKDALGNQADYTYDLTTGQVLTITSPAPASGGTRPKTTLAYSPVYAWVKNASGTTVQAPTPISVLVSSSQCLTTASCVGTADERKVEIGYQSGSSSTPSNILPVSTTAKAGDNSVSATAGAEYDIVGNVIKTDGPLSGSGDTASYRYDALRRQTGNIGPDPDGAGALPNAASRVTYNTAGRVASVEQGTTAGQTDSAWTNFTPAAKSVSTYDSAGREITRTVQNGSTIYAQQQSSYDARGRVECVAVRMNPAAYASVPSSACTLGTEGSDGKDRIAKYTYDAAGQVTKVEQGYGTSAIKAEQNSYTTNGQVAYVIDAESNRTTYEYDGHDRLAKTRYPVSTKGANASSTTDYQEATYDAASNLTNVRLRDGATVAMTYDHLNRMITRQPQGEAVVNTSYNLLGMVTAVQRPADSTNIVNSFDAIGRLTSQSQKYGTMSFQYDSAGSLKRMAWGDGFYVDYDYDNLSRNIAIRENGATTGLGVLATYAYDDIGRRSAVTYGNGTSRTYSWDPVSRLSGLRIDLAGTTSDLTVGQVSGVGTPITYNPASQIKALSRSNDAYAYGGRYNVSRGYSANGLNQYSSAGSTSFAYDARGNLTSSGSSMYGYSKLNELKSAPGVSQISYDGLGRLQEYVTNSATRFIYAGGNPVAEMDASGTLLRRYVLGSGVDEPVVWYEGSGTADRRWLQADERGSIVAVSDAVGNSVGLNTYDEHGIPASANIGRYQYTGQTWFPELGMYNYKARIYSPTLGRFLQTDPIGYGDGLNWYGYAGNDPVNSSDPSGTCVQVGPETGPWPDCPSGGGGGGYRAFGWANNWRDEIPTQQYGLRLLMGLPLGPPTEIKWQAGEKKAQPQSGPCPAVPSPGLGRGALNQRVNATAARRAVRERDFFSIPSVDNRLELFTKSVPGARNDTKAYVRGSAQYGNFLFGAESAAAGLSLQEALDWGANAQSAQDVAKLQLPTGSDNPGDAAAVSQGYRYFQSGCSRR